MSYYYGMRIRPFGIGCQPKNGLLGCTEDFLVTPDKTYWDVIEYDRKLTDEECDHYSLDFIQEVEA